MDPRDKPGDDTEGYEKGKASHREIFPSTDDGADIGAYSVRAISSVSKHSMTSPAWMSW
jgi:hypothetical protein